MNKRAISELISPDVALLIAEYIHKPKAFLSWIILITRLFKSKDPELKRLKDLIERKKCEFLCIWIETPIQRKRYEIVKIVNNVNIRTIRHRKRSLFKIPKGSLYDLEYVFGCNAWFSIRRVQCTLLPNLKKHGECKVDAFVYKDIPLARTIRSLITYKLQYKDGKLNCKINIGNDIAIFEDDILVKIIKA